MEKILDIAVVFVTIFIIGAAVTRFLMGVETDYLQYVMFFVMYLMIARERYYPHK